MNLRHLAPQEPVSSYSGRSSVQMIVSHHLDKIWQAGRHCKEAEGESDGTVSEHNSLCAQVELHEQQTVFQMPKAYKLARFLC